MFNGFFLSMWIECVEINVGNKTKSCETLGCKPREPQHSGLIDWRGRIDEDGNQLDDDNNDND